MVEMGLSSYEIVRRAIEFQKPPRMPVRFASCGLDDTHLVYWNQIGSGDYLLPQTYDEWGCLWVRSETKNIGQVKGHPLNDWSSLSTYRWPDPDDSRLYSGMEEKFKGPEGKYVLTRIFMLLWERMYALRGFENALVDLLLERKRIEILADRIVEYDIAVIENIAERFPGAIHGLRFTDDWGTERSMFIDPSLWEDFFKPRYARIFRAAHDKGWHVWMHTCGKVNAIIEHLIDIGLDVINLQQPRILGIQEIGERFRGRVCFESLCDIQQTLPFKGAEEIREEARLLLECWATKDGGFILSDYANGEAIGIDDEKKRIMLETFLEFDPWKANAWVNRGRI
ncbi:MAG: hypothetical protein HPY71_15475 [Firmicutes bacterium]|nr:hypothetical protein [Bacillota bacterium]